MALKYLDGGRITGLSTDAKPTDIPTGSSFVETDSGATLVYNGTTWIYDTFESINDAFGKSGGVTQRHHFVEYFSGSTLDTEFVWTLQHIGGSICTATLDDSIDGGLKMYVNDTAPISASASLTLGASSRKPFSPYGSTLIANMKKHSVSSDNIAIKYGLADDSTVTPPNCVLMCEGNLHSYKGIETNNESRTDSSVAKSTDWFNFKLDLNVSNCTASIDGSVAITKTTDIPTNILQPFLYIQSRGAGTNERQWNTNYLEIYNH